MKQLGFVGVRRGKVVNHCAKQGVAVPARSRESAIQGGSPQPVMGIGYVSTWQGWLYVAFVIDVFARQRFG